MIRLSNKEMVSDVFICFLIRCLWMNLEIDWDHRKQRKMLSKDRLKLCQFFKIFKLTGQSLAVLTKKLLRKNSWIGLTLLFLFKKVIEKIKMVNQFQYYTWILQILPNLYMLIWFLRSLAVFLVTSLRKG